jgi:MFS family permease
MTVAALMPFYWLYALLLVPTGLCSITFLNSCNSSVQLATAPELRGRVLAFYVAIQQGTTPIGAPIIGWLGSAYGARWSVLVGGVVAIGAALLAMAVLVRQPSIKGQYEEAIHDEHEAEAALRRAGGPPAADRASGSPDPVRDPVAG